MRRQDREILDKNKIHGIIASCKICRIGFIDNGEAYIVPLNFGAVFGDEDSCTFYFHGAKEGRKYGLIQKGGKVSFEMDTGYKLNEADLACGCSAAFQSVMGTGRLFEVTDFDEKIFGLKCIMKQSTGKGDWTFDENMLSSVCVFKVVSDSISCKEHL